MSTVTTSTDHVHASTLSVRTMLDTQSYNVSMIAPLEEFLMFMCNGTVPYMFDAVRILIKLYSLFPYHQQQPNDSTRKNKILNNMGLACLLALSYGSENQDIIAIRYMIPTAYVPKDNVNVISQVFHCATLYDSASFVDFWTHYHTSFIYDAKSALVTEFDKTIRQLAMNAIPTLQTSILIVLSITYQQAPIDIVLKAMNVSDMVDIAKNNTNIIQSFDSTCVYFIPTSDNTKRERTYHESINYPTISNIRFHPIETMKHVS
jgi:hypothetical protein